MLTAAWEQSWSHTVLLRHLQLWGRKPEPHRAVLHLPTEKKKATKGKLMGISSSWCAPSCWFWAADFIQISARFLQALCFVWQHSAPELPSCTAGCLLPWWINPTILHPSVCDLSALQAARRVIQVHCCKNKLPTLHPVVYSSHCSGREQKDLTFLRASREVTK